jgi:acyl carrier protein phosphodiesterase
MERVLLGMSRRVPNGEVLKNGWRDLVPVYTEVEQQFETFFGAMKTALKEQ